MKPSVDERLTEIAATDAVAAPASALPPSTPDDARPVLPERDFIQLLLQSPHRLYLYWTFARDPHATLREAFGELADGYRAAVRLIKVESGEEFLLDAPGERAQWFEVYPRHVYRAEVGFHAPGRPFVRLLASNTVTTPPDRASHLSDEDQELGLGPTTFRQLLDGAGYERYARGLDAEAGAIHLDDQGGPAVVTPERQARPRRRARNGGRIPASLITRAARIFQSHPARAPALRAPPGTSRIFRRRLALRSHHRSLPAAAARPLRPARSRRAPASRPEPLAHACEMLADPLLQTRYTRHLENLSALAEKRSHARDSTRAVSRPPARMYRTPAAARWLLARSLSTRSRRRFFRALQDAGVARLKLCGRDETASSRSSRRRKRAARKFNRCRANYEKAFGRRPRGIWLPDCAVHRGGGGSKCSSPTLSLEYFIADTQRHHLRRAAPSPRPSTRPSSARTASRLRAADPRTSQQVWSSIIGYPGDQHYREFYRDIGWDAPHEYLLPHLHADGERRHLGLKYHRVTGRDVPLDANNLIARAARAAAPPSTPRIS
jgi:hypothetical protein